MDSQTDRLFNSAVERLPGPLGAALKAAELVDPCTLRFYPRWSYEQLLEKGIGRGRCGTNRGDVSDRSAKSGKAAGDLCGGECGSRW